MLLAALSSQRVFADDKQQEGEALFSRGRQLWDVRKVGNPSFRLTAQFRTSSPTLGETEGTYTEVWASPKQWRWEITAGSYHQVEVGNEKSHWVSNSLSFESSRFRRVPSLLSLAELDIDAFKVKRVRDEIQAGIRVRCVEVKTDDHRDGTFCFDPVAGVLVSISRRSSGARESYEYSDYANSGSLKYPRRIRVRYDDTLEVTISALVPEPSPQEALFVPPNGSSELPVCRWTRPPKPLETPDPAYPSGQVGSFTVVLWTIIETDGKPRGVRVAKSAGSAFDAAAMQAVQRWTFQPATCSGQPVPFQINIEINFQR